MTKACFTADHARPRLSPLFLSLSLSRRLAAQQLSSSKRSTHMVTFEHKIGEGDTIMRVLLFICIYFKLQAHMRKSVDSLVLYAYFVLWFDPIILVKEAALLRDDHQCFKHGSVVFSSWQLGLWPQSIHRGGCGRQQ